MSRIKKAVRQAFRDAVFRRDGWLCRVCRREGTDEDPLDAHHVIDRHDMPNGGYVPENGISLCSTCHRRAEEWHETGIPSPGYSPEDLLERIGSSIDAAIEAAEKLGGEE